MSSWLLRLMSWRWMAPSILPSSTPSSPGPVFFICILKALIILKVRSTILFGFTSQHWRWRAPMTLGLTLCRSGLLFMPCQSQLKTPASTGRGSVNPSNLPLSTACLGLGLGDVSPLLDVHDWLSSHLPHASTKASPAHVVKAKSATCLSYPMLVVGILNSPILNFQEPAITIRLVTFEDLGHCTSLWLSIIIQTLKEDMRQGFIPQSLETLLWAQPCFPKANPSSHHCWEGQGKFTPPSLNQKLHSQRPAVTIKVCYMTWQLTSHKHMEKNPLYTFIYIYVVVDDFFHIFWDQDIFWGLDTHGRVCDIVKIHRESVSFCCLLLKPFFRTCLFSWEILS